MHFLLLCCTVLNAREGTTVKLEEKVKIDGEKEEMELPSLLQNTLNCSVPLGRITLVTL